VCAAAENCKITETSYFERSKSFKVINVELLKSLSAVIVTVSSKTVHLQALDESRAIK